MMIGKRKEVKTFFFTVYGIRLIGINQSVRYFILSQGTIFGRSSQMLYLVTGSRKGTLQLYVT